MRQIKKPSSNLLPKYVIGPSFAIITAYCTRNAREFIAYSPAEPTMCLYLFCIGKYRAVVRKGSCMIRAFLAHDLGQSLVEYGLVLVLIMVVVVAIFTLVGGKVSGMYTAISSGLS